MRDDIDTSYRFDVGGVRVLSPFLEEESHRGITLPVVSHKNENQEGKLNVPEVSMTVDPDLIMNEEIAFPDQWMGSIAEALFEEAAHGLDIGSGMKSAQEAWDAEVRFHTNNEPRMDAFRAELAAFLICLTLIP